MSAPCAGDATAAGTDQTERISAGGIAFHNSGLGLGYRGSTSDQVVGNFEPPLLQVGPVRGQPRVRDE